MLTDQMIAALRCPLCRQPLRAGPSVLTCAGGHSFDLARQGYALLGTGKALPLGDTAPMVEARAAFFATGHFDPLMRAVAQKASGDLIVDLGAGPGTYLAHVLERLPHAQGVAFDVSKPALKRAAKAHPRLGAVGADTWGELPLRDNSIDTVLNIFAPRNGPQMHRVLKPDGQLIVVTPEPGHLAELRDQLGLLKVDESKPARVAATLSEFSEASREVLTWEMELTAAQATAIVHMGPNAFHAAGTADAMRVTASVAVTTWTGRLLPTPADRHDSAR
nr:methyltransferase domain-containing protein [Catelliglobosispora koreensis]